MMDLAQEKASDRRPFNWSFHALMEKIRRLGVAVLSSSSISMILRMPNVSLFPHFTWMVRP
jgi:hypothetical protein